MTEVAWFVDGAYLFKAWINRARPGEALDYAKLRALIEAEYLAVGEQITEAYYFNAEPDPPSPQLKAFHNALAYAPPHGPGLRPKTYWLQKRRHFWPSALGGAPVLHPQSGQQFETTHQKAVDVSLAFHLMRSHARRGWKKLFLAAGDADFHELVQHLVESENVSLYLIGSSSSISDTLRPYATATLELQTIAPRIARARLTRAV